MKMLPVTLCVLVLAACDQGLSDYDDLTGAYAGTATADDQEVSAITVIDVDSQVDGELFGEIAVTGYFGGGELLLGAPFSGEVGQGRDPKVSIVVDNPCGPPSELSGRYATEDRSLVLSGNLGFPQFRCLGQWRVDVILKVAKRSAS